MVRPTIFSLVLVAACANCSNQKTPEARDDRPTVAAPASGGVAGPRVTGEGFVVEIKLPEKATVGTAATARVELQPTVGYHVNKDFPIKLEVQPVADVELPRPLQKKPDAARFEDAGAAFDVPFTPKAAGKKEFKAVFNFAVCTPQNCTPSRESLAWSVNVE